MPELIELHHRGVWQEIRTTPEDWDRADPQELLRMLNQLHVVRAFEETVIELDGQGLIHGPAHVSIGMDGGAVASAGHLRAGDIVTGSHRGHHQFVAKCFGYLDGAASDPHRTPLPKSIHEMLQRALAEILGLSQGYCRGRGGSMHLRWCEAGAYGTNAIVGGGVPMATGFAWAKKRQGKGDVVFSYFGDGAVNIGSVPEAMNLAAVWDLPVCFFIENNGYAVSTTVAEATPETRLSARGGAFGIPAFRVDGMDPLAVRIAADKAIARMRAGNGPTVIEALVYRYFNHGGGLLGSAFGYRTREEENQWKARDPLARLAREMIERKIISVDEEAGLAARAKTAMQQAADALTEKDGGKRKILGTLWPSTAFRDQGLRGNLKEFEGVRFEELEGASGEVQEVKFIDAVAKVMNRRMETDERVFVLGEDIHSFKGGTNGATRDLAERFPDRTLGTPITENGFVGFAGGVAIEGSYRPVVELMYPDFALVAADQLFNQIAKARHMFGSDTGTPLVLRTKVALGTGYGSQHSMDPAGLYALWPGWRIVAPTTPFDYVGLMNSALRCEDPVLVIEHVNLYNSTGPGPATDLDYCIPLGKAKVVRPGNRFTVLTYLAMTPLAVQVADEMDVDAEVVDLRSLDRAGLDWETIGASIRKTNNVVVLEQGPLTTPYGHMLTDEIQRRFFDWLDQPVQRIHGGESAPSVSKALERSSYVGAEEIRAGFSRLLAEIGVEVAER